MSLTLTLPLDVPGRPMDAKGLKKYLISSLLFFFFFSHFSMKKLNQLAKKKKKKKITPNFSLI